MIGVSNVTLEQLQCLWQEARVRPGFVQNRCYSVRGWDRHVREFCEAHELSYQGFSLLTANRQALTAAELGQAVMRRMNATGRGRTRVDP